MNTNFYGKTLCLKAYSCMAVKINQTMDSSHGNGFLVIISRQIENGEDNKHANETDLLWYKNNY